MELPVLNQDEVLQRLNISYKTLRKYEKKKKIRAIRLSRRVVRYFPSEVEKLKQELNERR